MLITRQPSFLAVISCVRCVPTLWSQLFSFFEFVKGPRRSGDQLWWDLHDCLSPSWYRHGLRDDSQRYQVILSLLSWNPKRSKRSKAYPHSSPLYLTALRICRSGINLPLGKLPMTWHFYQRMASCAGWGSPADAGRLDVARQPGQTTKRPMGALHAVFHSAFVDILWCYVHLCAMYLSHSFSLGVSDCGASPAQPPSSAKGSVSLTTWNGHVTSHVTSFKAKSHDSSREAPSDDSSDSLISQVQYVARRRRLERTLSGQPYHVMDTVRAPTSKLWTLSTREVKPTEWYFVILFELGLTGSWDGSGMEQINFVLRPALWSRLVVPRNTIYIYIFIILHPQLPTLSIIVSYSMLFHCIQLRINSGMLVVWLHLNQLICVATFRDGVTWKGYLRYL